METETAIETETVAPARRVRVVIVDDQMLLREGIASLLGADERIEVVGRGANGEEAIRLTEALRPDVVLTDIRMPVMDGIQAIRAIKARWPEVRVVILTSFAHDGYVLEGLTAGADGYLLKDASPAALISGIVAVADGGQVLEASVAQYVLELLGKQSAERGRRYDGLTQREVQMLTMLARGSAVKEIARQLSLSEKTVRNHISNIYQKLGIYDRSQVVLYAIKKGLVAAE